MRCSAVRTIVSKPPYGASRNVSPVYRCLIRVKPKSCTATTNTACRADGRGDLAHSIMTPSVRLVPFDSTWPTRFAAESERLHHALGGLAVAIEHVGSTAVPGLSGTPVLDIAIAVASASDADLCIASMQRLGYEYRGPYGADPGRR